MLYRLLVFVTRMDEVWMIYRTSNSGPVLEKLRPFSPTAIAHFVLETFLKWKVTDRVVYTEYLVSYSFLCVQDPGPTVRLITYSYIHICFSYPTPQCSFYCGYATFI
jgi:hypothetical protein